MTRDNDLRARFVHLFSSPLTAMRGAIDLLRHPGRMADDALTRDLLDAIERSYARLSRTVDILVQHSQVEGGVVEGDRMIVALMRMPAGTGAEPHSHPNEQWIYILEGTFAGEIAGKPFEAKPGSVVYVPANTIHSGKATKDGDVVFFTVKDASHSLHGVKVA